MSSHEQGGLCHLRCCRIRPVRSLAGIHERRRVPGEEAASLPRLEHPPVAHFWGTILEALTAVQVEALASPSHHWYTNNTHNQLANDQPTDHPDPNEAPWLLHQLNVDMFSLLHQ